MKRNMFGALMTLIVAFTVSVPVVQAQSNKMLSANVPFAFSIDGKPMPAGQYDVREAGARATIIESKDGSAHVLGIYNYAGDNTSQATKLVFDKVGDHYFLREVWTSASGQGLSIPRSKLEKEELASIRELGNGGAQTVMIALR